MDDIFEIQAGSSAPVSITSDGSHLKGWPPARFGPIPGLKLHCPKLQFGNALKHIDAGNSITFSRQSDQIIDQKRICPLLLCWAAQKPSDKDHEYLLLPPSPHPKDVSSSSPTNWIDDGGFKYPSDRIFIRKSYEDISDLILEEAARHPMEDGANMVLSGTSGTGKSFFSRYFVWRLLHPMEGGNVPETIVWRHKQGGSTGCMYHCGRFYMINQIEEFVSDVYCGNLLNSKDAWLIFDGEPPRDIPLCKCLVISSPGDLYKDHPHIKQFRRITQLRVYLPTWKLEELLEVSRVIHGFDTNKLADIVDRFKFFGGIARYVLQQGYAIGDPALTDPIKEALNTKAVLKVVSEVGTEDVDQTKASGVLIHLIPGETYRTIRYEWGSFYIMEQAWKSLFIVSKDKVQTLIAVGSELHLGTLFGMLFEPWFHTRISEQGYTGRLRKLTTGRELMENKKKKRNALGILKDNLGITEHIIPAARRHKFFEVEEIVEGRYNVPTNPNFPAIDSLWPSRGEMYQVTSTESHEIKTEALPVLRKIFANWLATNQTAKFIFVVPPSRFMSYTIQRYIEPKPKSKEGSAAAKEVTKELKKMTGGENPQAETLKAGEHIKVPTKKQSTVNLPKVPQKEAVESRPTTKLRNKKSRARLMAMKNQEDTGDKEKDEEVDPSTMVKVDWIEQFVLEMDVNPLHDSMVMKLWEEKEKKSGLGNTLSALGGKKK